MSIKQLKEKVLAGGQITRQEAIQLSMERNKALLYESAGEIRDKVMGRKFDLCSIVNARSGHCSEDCKWCAQSQISGADIEKYCLIDEKECIYLAAQNAEYGINKFSLVTAGKTTASSNLNTLCRYVRKIKLLSPLQLCASMGLLKQEQLKKLKDAGIRRYHCNLETSPRFFPELCTTHTIEEKIATIRAAQEVGLEVCSGGIIGMGETMEDRIDMALLLRELEVKSIPVNILNPIPNTPLADTPRLSDEEILTTIAVFRFMHPDSFLRFAGGRILIKHLEAEAIRAGINAAIVGDMLTTPGPQVIEDIIKIRRMGFEIL